MNATTRRIRTAQASSTSGRVAGIVYTLGRGLQPRLSACWSVLVLVLSQLAASGAIAQSPPMHFQHAGALPPGAIGFQQLQRGGPLPGYFQPVEIKGPRGSMISLAVENQFSDSRTSPVLAGMMIGPVYRLKVTNIPDNPGLEVFPTIEVINRLYPPPGDELKFPVPIELTKEELEMAAAGKFITRIVYLEDDDKQVPGALDPEQQSYFEVLPGDDPLVVADGLGRPMAIVRIGSRLPDRAGPDARFMFNSPPWLYFPKEEALRQQQARRASSPGGSAVAGDLR